MSQDKGSLKKESKGWMHKWNEAKQLYSLASISR